MGHYIYEEGTAKAAENMRLALSFMGQHKIPVSPLHYRLSYDYVTGNNLKLKLEFNNLLESNSPPSIEELYRIYCSNYAQETDAIDGMREELTSIITKIHNEFSRSGNSLSDYADKLVHFAEKLDSETPPSVLSAEVDRVISDTRETEESHRNMKDQLINLADEMATLKNELNLAREEALTDGLTGVSNRKAFDIALDNAIKKANENKSYFSLMLLDIDHFKSVNDNHGHLVGDKVLRFVGKAIRKCVKGDDITARYGGEEFAVILHDADIQGGEAVAEQIRKAVAAGILRDKKTQKDYGQVTISIGVAKYSPPNDPDMLISSADNALYRAKDNGRNRVELSA